VLQTMDYNDVNPKWLPSTTESPFIFSRLHLQLAFIHLAGASIQNDLQLLYILYVRGRRPLEQLV